MASRTSGKGSQDTAGTAKPRAGRTTGGAAKKAAPAKPSAKKSTARPAPARKPAVKKVPAKKAAAARPAPSPTGGVYRVVRAVWLGLAHALGAMLRGIGRGAKGLDPAHRKDGLALLLIGLALIIAAGTWANLQGPVGDLVDMLVTGSFGRLDLLVPLLVGAMAVRLILHPEKPEANGRIVVGLSALVVGVLGQVHIACGAPGRDAGAQAMQDAGGLIGWAASTPLVFLMSEVLAVPMLLLLTVFGLLVVTATPVNAIPRRLRALGERLGVVEPRERVAGGDDLRYDEQWRDALPPAPAVAPAPPRRPAGTTRSRRRRRRCPGAGGPVRAGPAPPVRRHPASSGPRTPSTSPRPPRPTWTAPSSTACRPRRWSPT
nr:hypothetical protein [Streptomyces sp. CC228A]